MFQYLQLPIRMQLSLPPVLRRCSSSLCSSLASGSAQGLKQMQSTPDLWIVPGGALLVTSSTGGFLTHVTLVLLTWSLLGSFYHHFSGLLVGLTNSMWVKLTPSEPGSYPSSCLGCPGDSGAAFCFLGQFCSHRLDVVLEESSSPRLFPGSSLLFFGGLMPLRS